MDKKSSLLFKIFPVVYLGLAFFYIHFAIQPRLIFHHQQPPFISSPDFWKPYLNHPGGISELISTFLMQSFYYKYMGTLVFFGIAASIKGLVSALLNAIHKNSYNLVLAFIPLTFGIVLTNNYNLPFSVIVSLFLILILLLL